MHGELYYYLAENTAPARPLPPSPSPIQTSTLPALPPRAPPPRPSTAPSASTG